MLILKLQRDYCKHTYYESDTTDHDLNLFKKNVFEFFQI